MPRRRVVVVGPPRRRGPPIGTLALGAVAGAAIANSGSKKQQAQDTTETVINVHVDGLPQNPQMPQPCQQSGHYPPQPVTYAPPQPNYHQNYYPPPNSQPPPPPPPAAYPPSGAAYPPTQPPSGVPPTNQGYPPPPYGWN